MINTNNGRDFAGLSTDTKPTTPADLSALGLKVPTIWNGAAFIELDTSKLYFFDAENAIWREWGA